MVIQAMKGAPVHLAFAVGIYLIYSLVIALKNIAIFLQSFHQLLYHQFGPGKPVA